MKESVKAISLLGLRELVAGFGGDLDALAAEVGLALPAENNTDCFLPARKVHALTNLAAQRVKRKDLGLLWGAKSDPRRLGPLYVALMNARTGRDAVELIARYLQTQFPAGEVFIKPVPRTHQDLIGLRSLLQHPPPLIQFYERRIASLHVILKIACEGYRPDAVWFTHEQNAADTAYRRVFGIQPSFSMPENGIVVSRHLLDKPREHAHPQVREMAIAYLAAQSLGADQSISREAAHATATLLRQSDCRARDVARAMAIDLRTLQRRLQRENTSLQAIRDQVRREEARILLADSKASFSEIAFRLHFSGMPAFSRSCRRWFNDTPTQVRRRLLKKMSSAGRKSQGR